MGLAIIALVLAMIAQFAFLLQRTGLPYVAVLVDDSLSMTIVDRYEEPLRKLMKERVASRGRRQASSAAGIWPSAAHRA